MNLIIYKFCLKEIDKYRIRNCAKPERISQLIAEDILPSADLMAVLKVHKKLLSLIGLNVERQEIQWLRIVQFGIISSGNFLLVVSIFTHLMLKTKNMQEMTRDIYNMGGQAFGSGVHWCLVAERQNLRRLFSSMNLMVEKSMGIL